MRASSSPRLIAGNHVLHRLCVPRYPPWALCSLTNLSSWTLTVVENRFSYFHPSAFTVIKNTIKLWFARHKSKNAQESRLSLKRIFIALVPNTLSNIQTQNNASVRCFVFPDFPMQLSRFCQTSNQKCWSLNTLVRAQRLINQFLSQHSFFGMTGSWGHPADTSKSHITIELNLQ